MKTVIIGIDSLDPILLEKFGDELPTLSKLRQTSPPTKLKSIFPPDSIPAWISIFTGLNPAQHGTVYVYDVFQTDWQDILNFDTNLFKNKTFWDKASADNKKVCVLFPLMAAPAWPVNGIMVSRSIEHYSVEGQPEWVAKRLISTYPKEIQETYNIPTHIQSVSGSPPPFNSLKKHAGIAQNALIEEAEIGLKLLLKEDWDLYFIYFSWLDTICHQYWRFYAWMKKTLRIQAQIHSVMSFLKPIAF